jgi:hypothetical protein
MAAFESFDRQDANPVAPLARAEVPLPVKKRRMSRVST